MKTAQFEFKTTLGADIGLRSELSYKPLYPQSILFEV